METSLLICRANQLAGFYMMTTLAFNELRTFEHLNQPLEMSHTTYVEY